MKKVLFCILCVVELIGLACVYLIGGMAGAYAWSLAIFIVAPIALLTIVIQVIVFALRLFKKKTITWNIIFIVLSFVLSYPITILVGISNITYPIKSNTANEIEITMPVDDAVLFGGKNYKTHAVWPSECYAYDILCEPYNTGDSNLNNYGIYLKDVVAPVSGKVVGVKNSEEDIAPNTEEFTSSLGNYIFLEIDTTGTYMVLAHLEKGSINVSVGEHVIEGEYIAKVGNSGTTSEPHLHIQHQRNNPVNMIYPTCSEGLPMKFK